MNTLSHPSLSKRVMDVVLADYSIGHVFEWVDTSKRRDQWRYHIILTTATEQLDVTCSSADDAFKYAARFLGIGETS